MKITLLTSTYPTKGISIYSHHLLTEFGQKDVKIEVMGFNNIYPKFLYPNSSVDEDKRNIKYEDKKITIKNFINWYNPLSWIRAGFTATGDIIHVQWWSIFLFPIYLTFIVIAKYIKRKKIIITLHNVLPHEGKKISKILCKIIYYLCDYYIVHNENNKKTLSKTFKINENLIKIIPIGIYNNNECRIINTIEARKKLNFEVNKKYLLFLGHIRDYKGLDVLLKSMRIIIDTNPGIQLIIAGTVWGKWDKYQEIINKNKLNNNIIKILRYISDEEISYLVSAVNLVVLPYKYFDSSSGLVKIVLFFEKPIIVTDVGDLGELVANPNFVAEPNDYKDLAVKILKVINDPFELDRNKTRIKELKQSLKWEKIIDKHFELYNKYLNK